MDALFHRRVGPAGRLVRLLVLALGGVLSYLVGAGLGEVMMKAPVAMALIFGAVLLGLAAGDPDTE